MKNNYFDLHVHSLYSFDYSPSLPNSLDAVCAHAYEAGLSGIAFTDHYCVNQVLEGRQPEVDFDVMYREICRMQNKWKGKLKILRGIELGQPEQAKEKALACLRTYQPEFVIGSLHNNEKEDDFFYIDYETVTPNELIRLWDEYLEGTLKLLDFGHFHTLGHLGYPARYYSRHGFGHLCNYNEKKEVLGEIFKKMREMGVALECNVSNLRLDPPGKTMFPLELVDFYLDCGNRLVTVGSDAHVPSHTGSFVAPVTDFLVEKGCSLLSDTF